MVSSFPIVKLQPGTITTTATTIRNKFRYHYRQDNNQRHTVIIPPLYAVMDKPPSSWPRHPMEEEREKDNNCNDNDNDNDDSTATAAATSAYDNHVELQQAAGGFITKFLRRRSFGIDDAVVVSDPSSSSSSTSSSINQQQQQRPVLITTVDTLEDYKRIVVNEQQSIMVVRFHASWCKSCKAAYPLFHKLASEYNNNNNNSGTSVKFVEVPLTKDTAYLHEGLGVPSVPFGHIYYPNVGLVEECKLNRKVFGEFKSVLEDYVRGSCDIPSEEEDEEEEKGIKNHYGGGMARS
jgi:thiol-disulfide isomerase/thioredoxin